MSPSRAAHAARSRPAGSERAVLTAPALRAFASLKDLEIGHGVRLRHGRPAPGRLSAVVLPRRHPTTSRMVRLSAHRRPLRQSASFRSANFFAGQFLYAWHPGQRRN